MKRKFNIGDKVAIKSGKVAEVVGSALYGTYKGMITGHTFVEYRLKPQGSKRTIYRTESKLLEYKAVTRV